MTLEHPFSFVVQGYGSPHDSDGGTKAANHQNDRLVPIFALDSPAFCINIFAINYFRYCSDQRPNVGRGGVTMTIERTLRLVAGFFVLLSLALARWVHPNWLLFTAFVGLNLFQSAFTNWCPLITILRKLGMREQAAAGASARIGA
jgi:hypothetical protein